MIRLVRLLLILFLCAAASALAAKTPTEIAAENTPSVVTINVLRQDGATFNATGFIVTEDGLIATARHVLDQALIINITFQKGAVSDPAQPIAISQEVDLALLKVPAKNLPVLTIADSDYTLPGNAITVIGNPRRLQNTVSTGIISQVRKTPSGTLLHQISAPISPSSSGSPVFNTEGQVISVVFSTYQGDGNQNLNFSVPSNYLTELMLAHGYTPTFPTADNTSLSYWQKLKRYWKNVALRLFSQK